MTAAVPTIAICVLAIFAWDKCGRATAESCNANDTSQQPGESTNNCNSTCTSDDITLVGGSGPIEGTVQLCVNGNWSALCDDDWSDHDIAVACRQLAHGTIDYLLGTESSDVILDGINVSCTGSETKLTDCPNNATNCTNRHPVGVECSLYYAPQNVSADVFNSTSVFISWRPPLYGSVLRYNLSCTPPVLNITLSLSPNTTSQQLAGLFPYSMYTCCVWALNSYGGWGRNACIIVTTPPSVLIQTPTNFSVSVINSTCIVLKWSPPVLSWYNGPLLNYSVEIIPQMDTTQRSLISTVQTVLILSSLHPFYNYTCTVTAYTAAGEGPSTPPITVTTLQDVPSGPPVRFKDTATGPTFIVMEWDLPAPSKRNGIILGYTVTITTVMTGQIQTLNTTNTSITVGLLKPYSNYSCTVSAKTEIGSGPQAIPRLIQTMEETPTGPPLNISHSTPNSSTLVLTWSPPDLSYRNGVVRGYLVVIVELETSQKLYFNTSTPPLSIPSLHPFYTYNCSVSAYTVGFPGPSSPPYLVRMPQSVPTRPPLNLSLVTSTSISITLSWSPPPTQYQNGIIMGYTLQVFNTQQSFPNEINISSTRSTVESLNPDTTYLFKVAAMTVVGRGPYSDNIYVTTRHFVPLIPPNVSTPVRLSAEAILLSWEPIAAPDTTQGVLIGYSVRYRPTTAVTKRDTSQGYTLTSTTQTQITISSLDPTLAYMVGVAAVTQAGIGGYSENTVGLYENSLFQVYMQAPGVVCKEWTPYGTMEKIQNIVGRIISDLGYSFPITYIGDAGLLCDKQQLNWIVLTGRAVGTKNLNSSGMVHQLQEWVLTSPKVPSQGVILQVLASCPISLTQLKSPGCTVAMATTPSPTLPVVSAVSNTDLASVVSVSAGIGVVLLVLIVVVAFVILYVRRKTRTTFIVSRDMTLTTTYNVCHEVDNAAFTKETDLDGSIYASIGDLHKPPEGCCNSTSDCETVPRRTRALSNQYFDASISPALCHNTSDYCNGAYLALTVVSEEPAGTGTAPSPPPRLPAAAATSRQSHHSVSSPNLASETVPVYVNSEPRCSTPSLAVYTDLSIQNGQKTSKSLPTDLCTVTAGPSLLRNSTEDIYIEMVGESAA